MGNRAEKVNKIEENQQKFQLTSPLMLESQHHQPSRMSYSNNAIDSFLILQKKNQQQDSGNNLQLQKEPNKKIQNEKIHISLQEEIKYYEFEAESQKKLSSKSQALRRLLYSIGVKKYKLVRYQQSLEYFSEALTFCPSLHGYNSQYEGNILYSIGLNYDGLNQKDKALKYYEEALKIFIGINQESKSVARTLNCIGIIYENRNSLKKALQHYEKALSIKIKLFGKESIDVINSLNNIAIIFKKQHNYQQAQHQYKIILKAKQKAYGLFHPKVALTAYNLAICHFEMKKYEEGLEEYQLTFSIMKELSLWNHPQNQSKYMKSFEYDLRKILEKDSVPFDIYKRCLLAIEKTFFSAYKDNNMNNLAINLLHKMGQMTN